MSIQDTMNEQIQKMAAMQNRQNLQAAMMSSQPTIAQQVLMDAYNTQKAAFQPTQFASPTYGISDERAKRCEHLTVYYIDTAGGEEGRVVREAKFPLSVIDGDDFNKNYQSMTYPYPAFGTRDAAEAFIRDQARSGFRANADALLKKLTDLIFKRGCTGDSETKLLNDRQDYLRGDK